MKYRHLPLTLILALLLVGCGGNGSQPEKAPVVTWPALKSLDGHWLVADEHIHAGNEAQALPAVRKMLAALPELIAGGPPENARDPDAIRVMLEQDVASLAEVDPGSLQGEELDAFVHSFHDLIAELGELAGIPHTHDH